MLDVRRLRVLCAVADHTTLSGAADALSYTPSAVSQSIVALERQLGVRLLHRSPRGVRLTAAGRTLVDRARPLLAGLQEAEDAIAGLSALGAGSLHLATFATAGATLIPRAIAGFRAAHPEVAVTLVQANPDEAMQRLRTGDVDLIVTADAEPGRADNIEVVHLLDDPLLAVLPGDHPLTGRDELRLEDLAADTWIDPPAGSESRRLLLQVCGRAGFIPRVAFESDEYTTVASLVAAGAGVALIPQMALGSPPPGVQVRALAGPPLARSVAAALHAPEYRAPAAAAMLALLQEEAECRRSEA